MKTKKIALILCVVLLCSSTLLYAKSDSDEGRARIGVLLDNRPLPDLLVKHLRLEPEQGVRISNVQQNSPADKAGLERDDIIIGFEDEKIKSLEQLVDAVQQAGVGADVSLEIIHLGERKTIELQLEAFRDEPGLKYPSEPEIFQSWRPGRMFWLKPGGREWMEMELPFDEKSLEVYEYHHSDDGESYSITIEGDPDNEDTLITVRIGNDEYKTTIGEIDKLPEKYREAAQDALENSQKHSGERKKTLTRKFSLPSMVKPDEFLKYFEERDRFHLPPDLPKFGPDNKMFDKIEEQMRKLQERIEELEKRLKETPGRSSRETDKDQI
jgi:DNA-binding protein YbaB